MNKKLAFDNRLCYERTLARQQAIHHQKLQSMVPTALSPSKVYLDDNAPSKQPHLASNPKRKQLDRERQMDITTQNHRLASKMEQIMHRQENVQLAAASTYGLTKSPRVAGLLASSQSHSDSTSTTGRRSPPRTPAPPPPSTSNSGRPPLASGDHFSPTPPPPKTPLLSPKKPAHGPARVHMPGIRLDATQTPIVDCYLSPEVAIGRGAACIKRSLINRGVQKREQARIAEENRRMKQRVQSQKPFYNTKKWDTEWLKGEHKFSHIQKNGTVGYLLPPPRTASSGLDQHLAATASPRALKAQRSVQTSQGLPLLEKPTSKPLQSRHNHQRTQSRGPSRATRRLQQSVASSATYDDGQSDDGMQVFELPLCVLLEATTRQGVELEVAERQILLRPTDVSNSPRDASELGDRGLVIRGAWHTDVLGGCDVTLETLETIAQELDDLEIMIKLETVRQVTDVGNFPRLSVLLTEGELEKLLVRLVQRLHIDVRDTERKLLISTRHLQRRGGGGGSGDDACETPSSRAEDANALGTESHERRRPHTCPSVMPSANARSLDFIDTLESDDSSAHTDHDAGSTMSLRMQLSAWLSVGATRFGIRLQDSLYLVRIACDARSARLAIRAVRAASSAQLVWTHVDFSDAQVAALVQQLASHATTRDRVVVQEIERAIALA